jgi:hypothetical protein
VLAAPVQGGLVKESNIRAGKSRAAHLQIFVALLPLFHYSHTSRKALQLPRNIGEKRSSVRLEFPFCAARRDRFFNVLNGRAQRSDLHKVGNERGCEE